MATVAKPLSSPLPPLPSKFAGPAPMSIPRRPVAAAPVTPTPVLAPTAPAGPASPNPIPSPAGSYSSLLSAYSNHTADSPRSPSENSGKAIFSSANSYSIVSPALDTQRSSAQSDAPAQALPRPEQNAQKEEPNGRRVFEQSSEELPPPLPVKDAQREVARVQTPTSSVQAQTTQSKTSPVAGSPLGNDPAQQEQLWRRRSRSLKSERPPAIPELKLVSSHGSTAASAQNTAQSGPGSLFPQQPITLLPGSDHETSTQSATSRAPPRSANGGLPGRNIRPELVGEHTAARGGEASMGQDGSRVKEKLHIGKTTKRESAEEADKKIQEAQVKSAVTAGPTISPLSAQRLPSPLSDTALSPLALSVSPELPGEAKPVARKPVGAPDAQIRHAKSIPTLAPESKNLGLGVRTLAGLPTSPRPDLSKDANQKQYIPYSPPPAGNQAPSQTQFPARASSREDGDQSAQPPTPRQEPSPVAALPAMPQRNPEPQNPSAGGLKRAISEAGSVETVKAPPAAAASKPPVIREPDHIPSLALDNHRHSDNHQNDLLPLREPDPNQPDHTDHPGAALFPRNWYNPSPALGGDDNNNNMHIPDARPLTDRHYRCLTQHRYMTANKQRTNPVACRTCGHKDRNAECYICSACHLNVCSGCAGLLKRLKGDLRAVLREVGGKN
ncbi:uncharacterized protein B0T15DRAFT_403455 [Chaetomium strumarium]|uniref:Uncharacterized protein n=1 Tax=Chaetomium strumarium TaxID=1170767 RepID=A0AAJ0LY99_9PEZI|nr:hypothetical protein B0T15DRAFT_403455 [Chaetomium strumarium]